MTTPDPTRPDYRALAETLADEAAFRHANGETSPGGDPLAVVAVALTSLAAIGVAVCAELRELRLTVEAGVDTAREALSTVEGLTRPTDVEPSAACSCRMARVYPTGPTLLGGVLHRTDGPCYNGRTLEDVPTPGGNA